MKAVMWVIAQLPSGNVEFLDMIPFDTLETCQANIAEMEKSWAWVLANVPDVLPVGTAIVVACQ